MLEIDMGNYAQALFALVIVIFLILVVAGLLRRFGPMAQGGIRAGRTRRLQVVESTLIDAKHRLVLVRKDGREHLLLLGSGSTLLVESDPAPLRNGAEADEDAGAGEPTVGDPRVDSGSLLAAGPPRIVNVNPPATTSGQS